MGKSPAARGLLPFCRRWFSAVRCLWSPPPTPLPPTPPPAPSGQPAESQVLPNVSWGRSRPVEGRGVASWDAFHLRLRFTPASSSPTAGGRA